MNEKILVRAATVPSRQKHLTAGKIYVAIPEAMGSTLYHIEDDIGGVKLIHIGPGGCAHLEDDHWELFNIIGVR